MYSLSTRHETRDFLTLEGLEFYVKTLKKEKEKYLGKIISFNYNKDGKITKRIIKVEATTDLVIGGWDLQYLNNGTTTVYKNFSMKNMDSIEILNP